MSSTTTIKAGIVVGALLTMATLFGLLGTVFGMVRAFHALGPTGIADPRGLSHSVGNAVVSTAGGLILCPFGIALLAVSLVFYFRMRRGAPDYSGRASERRPMV